MGLRVKVKLKRWEGGRGDGWAGLAAVMVAVVLEGASGWEGFGLLDLSIWAIRVRGVGVVATLNT